MAGSCGGCAPRPATEQRAVRVKWLRSSWFRKCVLSVCGNESCGLSSVSPVLFTISSEHFLVLRRTGMCSRWAQKLVRTLQISIQYCVGLGCAAGGRRRLKGSMGLLNLCCGLSAEFRAARREARVQGGAKQEERGTRSEAREQGGLSLSVCLSVRPSVRPSVRLSVCPSVRPSVCLSVCLSVYFVV